MTPRLPILVSCALLSAAATQAANITWVSFHAPGANQNAMNNGFSTPPDVGYTDLLTGAGHNVTRFLTIENLQNNPSAIATLNASDLVIISRSVPSGHYQDLAEAQAWNSLTAPTMILGGYILRGSRLGYTTGDTIPDTTSASVKLTVNNPSHPIFAGIALDGSNTTVDNFANLVAINGVNQRGISVNTSPQAGSPEVLATIGTAGDGAFGGMVIAEYQAGATTQRGGTFGGDRLVFLTGSREGGTNPNTAAAYPSDVAGIYDLTGAGAQMFLNAVNYMAVPEPSTFSLLLIGAGAFMMRRRK